MRIIKTISFDKTILMAGHGNTFYYFMLLLNMKYKKHSYEKDEANVLVVFNPQTLNGVILEEKRLKLPLLQNNRKFLIYFKKLAQWSSIFKTFISTNLSHIFEG